MTLRHTPLLRALAPSRVALTHVIKQAKSGWKMARFESVPGDFEFIPLPDPDQEVVRYP